MAMRGLPAISPIGPAASQIVQQGNTAVSKIASTVVQVASSVEATVTNAIEDIVHQNLSLALGTRKACVIQGGKNFIDVPIPYVAKSNDAAHVSRDDTLDQAVTQLGTAAKIFGLNDAGSLLTGIVKVADGWGWLTPPRLAGVAVPPAVLSSVVCLIGILFIEQRVTQWLHWTVAILSAALSAVSLLMFASLCYVTAKVTGVVSSAAGKAGEIQSGPAVRDFYAGMAAAAVQVGIGVLQVFVQKIHHYWKQSEIPGKMYHRWKQSEKPGDTG